MTTSRRRRLWAILPLSIAGLLVAIYFLINAIVTFATQAGLDRVAGASGIFQRVSVTLIHPGYDVYGLTVREMPVHPHKEPLFYAERIEVRWSWRQLLHGKLVRRIQIWNARAMVPIRPGEEGRPAQPPLEIAKTLESVPSAALERLAIVHSQVILVDEHHAGQRLWLHDFDATVENVASRKELMHGLPLLVTVRGKLQKTGELSLYLTMDPFDKGYTFAGSAEVRHMQLSDLHDFTAIKGLTLPRGVLDVFASVTCKRGTIVGGIKPILKDAKVEAADSKIGDKIKAALADLAIKIFSDRVPGRDAVAAIIPIRGTLEHLDVQLVPAIAAVLRNAFVEGLSASLSNVPPPVGEKKGVVREIVQGLRRDRPAAEAQPSQKK